MLIDRLIIRVNAKVKWRVSRKLTVLVGVLLTALLLTGALSIYALSAANSRFSRTLDINIQRIVIASQMNDDLMRFDRLVVEHIRSRYQADQAKIETELVRINSHFNTLIMELKHLGPDQADDSLQAELEPSWVEYAQTVRVILTRSRNGRAEEAMEFWDGWASVRYRDSKYLIRHVIDANLQMAQAAKQDANRSLALTRRRIVGLILFVTLLSVLVGVIIIRYLQISLRNLILANERVSQGNLSQGLDLAIGSRTQDEFGELAESNRKVVESIKQMVDDVAGLTEKYLPQNQAAREELADGRELSNLMDITKTSALVRNLTQALKQVKDEIEQMCLSDLVNPELTGAHARTLATIDDLNKEMNRLGAFFESLAGLPEKLRSLALRYGSMDYIIGGLRPEEVIGRVREVSAKIANAMEVVKFGLLDQKMRLDAIPNSADGTEAADYFVTMAKAIKAIVKRAEAIIGKAHGLEQAMQRTTDMAASAGRLRPVSGPTSADYSEYQMFLARLERIMAEYTGKDKSTA